MVTDDERRDVARRLREANVRREFYSPWCKMVESVLDGIDCGEDDGTCDENACCERFMKRMADLIEPTTGDYDEGCRAGLQKARDMRDRDALLALAEDVRGYCIERQITPWVAGRIYDRIREACGEGER